MQLLSYKVLSYKKYQYILLIQYRFDNFINSHTWIYNL